MPWPEFNLIVWKDVRPTTTTFSDLNEYRPGVVCCGRRLQDIIRSQEHNKDLHEQFHNQLERASDSFSVIAEFYGKGIFNKVGFTNVFEFSERCYNDILIQTPPTENGRTQKNHYYIMKMLSLFPPVVTGQIFKWCIRHRERNSQNKITHYSYILPFVLLRTLFDLIEILFNIVNGYNTPQYFNHEMPFMCMLSLWPSKYK